MARKKLDMNALKNAFSDNSNSGSGNGNSGKYYAFYNMDVDDSCTVRFLPDLNEENDKVFLVEKKTHRLKINGKNEAIPCLTMYDEDCPICRVSSEFYNKDDKTLGKLFYRKVQHIGQVLVRKDPMENADGENIEGQVKAISINWQVFKIIKQAIHDGELDAYPFDYEEGTDFIIKKTQNGEWADYTIGTKFARRESELSDDEIEFVEKEIVDLRDYLPEKPSLEVVEAKLHAALTGTHYKSSSNSNDATDGNEEEEEIVKKRPRNSRKSEDDEPEVDEKVDVAEEVEEDLDSSVDEDDNPVLAKIRQRRAAAKKS